MPKNKRTVNKTLCFKMTRSLFNILIDLGSISIRTSVRLCLFNVFGLINLFVLLFYKSWSKKLVRQKKRRHKIRSKRLNSQKDSWTCSLLFIARFLLLKTKHFYNRNYWIQELRCARALRLHVKFQVNLTIYCPESE